MTRWNDVAAEAPDFATHVNQVFTAHRTQTLATLRRDGAPRISGIEMEFTDGDVWLGMMPGSLMAQDLRRDPRLALHSAPQDLPADDPSAWAGDVKLAGRAVEVAATGDAAAPPHRFRVEIAEVVLTRVGTPRTIWSSKRGMRGVGWSAARVRSRHAHIDHASTDGGSRAMESRREQYVGY